MVCERGLGISDKVFRHHERRWYDTQCLERNLFVGDAYNCTPPCTVKILDISTITHTLTKKQVFSYMFIIRNLLTIQDILSKDRLNRWLILPRCLVSCANLFMEMVWVTAVALWLHVQKSWVTSIFFILYPSPFPSCLAFNLEMSKRNHHKRSLQRKEQSERDRMYHFAGQTVSVLSITTLFPWLTLLRHIHSIKDMNQKAKLSPSSW